MPNPALKEWSTAVDALTQGQTILLLRKGGIRESRKQFTVPHHRVWLYPTFEHQQPHLLKPHWAEQVTAVEPGWHSSQVTLQSWAEITHVWTVTTLAAVEALLPFHIWNGQFVAERFRWKPSQPLHVLLLRVHRLTLPIQIDWQPAYGGCRSWLTLPADFEDHPSTPALAEQPWTDKLQAIQRAASDISIDHDILA